MNYTENYHLPQWEETDRIMRTDFNAAMAGIEDGLTDTREEATVRHQALDNQAYNRFCRMAYNQFRAAAAIGGIAERLNMFYHSTAETNKGLTGMVRFGDHYVVCNGRQCTTEELIELLEQICPLSVSSTGVKTPLRASFTAPSAGYFARLVFPITVSQREGTLSCLLEFKDLTENRVTFSQRFEVDLAENGSLDIRIPGINFHIGHNYELIVTPLQNNIPLTMRLFKGSAVYDTRSFAPGPVGTATHTFQAPGENSGVVVAASCDCYGDYAPPVLLWNGEEISPWLVIHAAGGEDGKIQEYIFRRAAPVEDGDTAVLRMTCGEGGGEINLYDWGAIML